MGAIGLDWEDLYPDDRETRKPAKVFISPRAALEILEKEAWVIFQYGNAYQQGENPDNTRLLQATYNIHKTKELLGLANG